MKHLFIIIMTVVLFLVGAAITKHAASKVEQIKNSKIAVLNTIK